MRSTGVRVEMESLMMRIATMIFAGSVAALTALATPVLARNSDATKPAEDNASSSSCHAYQMAADGSWTQLPCQEEGATGQPARKSATRNGTETQTH